MRDVKKKYLSGGVWKQAQLRKGMRASRTKSSRCKLYIAIPPITGWLGGDPVKNGYKPT